MCGPEAGSSNSSFTPPSFSLPPGCRGGKKMWVCVSVEEPDLKTVCKDGDVQGLLVRGCSSAVQWNSAGVRSMGRHSS